jgi:hypothetical protein
MKQATRKIPLMKSRWSRRAVALMCAISAFLAHPSLTCAGPREYDVKAAFIYNFTQFVEWPNAASAGDDAPFVVAVMGHDPFDGALEQILTNKFVGKRPIVIKHFDSAADVGPCQLLFVPATLDDSLRAILDNVGKAQVLTIGESEAFMAAGGGIRLFLEDGKMRFQINPETLDAATLKASAKLLKLARIYRK